MKTSPKKSQQDSLEDCPPIARGRANELTASVQQILREGTGQAEAPQGGPWGAPEAGDHRGQTNHSGGSSSELWVLPCSLFNGEPWGSKITPKRRKDMGIEWKSEQDVTNNLGESERAHHKVTTNGLLARGRTSKMT